ncbi:MAG: ABC transporter permease [Candidatus Marinimicrobia bacterium]|jgi:lipoprotein-releasing system permease protein|nr:ABC transporter permease [Candidatus Neomarinimicrobiota bacterium]MBT3501119.1 ABC transporter permease [Candidatus Neomarinimicrobiota bacterium]MBT3840515.1 ABC transporter permease [Candidatus Neomarinimicrobiota bacterium]MBT3999366.1 ABC transporter permease [Candidatus Neomarinimicrobiota bacterium]MBT4578451.1 ABC transporter permease [Candidatus Neomarinimicrobiota bacterium]
MNWENIVSKRFSNSSQKQGRILGRFSMVGMGVGCFAMIVSLSVMNGFESLVHEKLKGVEGDIRIVGQIDEAELIEISGVDEIMPYMERRGVIENGNDRRVVSLKAVDIQKMATFYTFPIRGKSPLVGEVVMGQDLAYRLGKDVGDDLMIYSPIDQSFGFGLPPKMKMTISGIFSTRVLDYDDRYVYLSLEDGNKLFSRKTGLDGIDIRIASNTIISSVKSKLVDEFGHQVKIQSWEDLNKSLVDAMKMERLGTIVILSLIFLVAAFNLVASLSLISIQKIKEVGILKAMGASPISIQKIMIRLGLSRAGKGAAYGFCFGVILVFLQNMFEFIPIPSDIYFISALPMVLSPKDYFIVILISFIIILIASFISGRKLSQTNIKDALLWSK